MIAILGTGKMGEALLSGLLRAGRPPAAVVAAVRREDRGATFDPVRHDAVATRADPGAADGSVIDVIRPAYGEGDHQLRPAQVVVARAG